MPKNPSGIKPIRIEHQHDLQNGSSSQYALDLTWFSWLDQVVNFLGNQNMQKF